MNVNKKLILKIILGILVFAVIVYVITFFLKTETPVNIPDPLITTEEKNTLPVKSEIKAVDDIAQIQAAPPVNSDEVAIRNTAKYIAEKFGSYSTDTFDYVNLKDAKYMSTSSLKSYIDTLVESYRSRGASGEYYGITTRSLSVEIINPESIEGDGIVNTIVSTQRSETFGVNSPVISTSYKNAEIEIIKVGDQWLANRIEWK